MDPRFLSEFLKIVKHPKRKVLSFASRPNENAVQDVQGSQEVPNKVNIVKNLLEQSLNIVVGLEIFEIAQKTKKLPLQSN